MKLSLDQCYDIIKSPRNRAYIDQARRQEDRLSMHTEAFTYWTQTNQALEEWKRWVGSILPADKMKRFTDLIQYPLETVSITNALFDELSKIFDTPDRAINFEFTVPDFQQDFSEYVEDKLNDENFWKEKGMEALKNKINAFLVVDLPEVQLSDRPEPYYYLLDINAVHDVVINQQSGAVEYIFFLQKNNRLIALDDEYYRVFEKPEQGDYLIKVEIRHSTYRTSVNAQNQTVYGDLMDGIGYCPACSFWELAIENTARLDKKGPMTSVLSSLDWLLYWIISQKYLKLYAAYPVTVRYETQCDYRDEQGNECAGGYITCAVTEGDVTRNIQHACPNCEKSGLIGPGTDLKVSLPDPAATFNIMEKPLNFVEVSNDKLEYGVSEQQRLEREIAIKTVGRMTSEASKEAQNEQQIRSQFEAQRSIMTRILEQFEASRLFVLDTVARLRYGRYYLTGSVYMGREFFLQSPEDLALRYKNAKASGLPRYELARIRETYSRTALKNNDLEYSRVYILSQLEPYVDSSVQELLQNGVKESHPDLYELKLNFAGYIDQFERENINVVEFASLRPFATKISLIKQKLTEYVKDNQPVTQPVAGANGAAQA